jgi:hypothetical protein
MLTLLVTVGFDTYALAADSLAAKKLSELLSGAVLVRQEGQGGAGECLYRVVPRSPTVRVDFIDPEQLLAPRPEDFERQKVLELQGLQSALRLLDRK